MNQPQRSTLFGGALLILLGLLFLAAQLMPDAFAWLNPARNWPLLVIGAGLLLLLLGLVTHEPDMAVPACIVGGIGALLYWQNATGRWESWAYAWALIPGFVGVGVIVAGLLSGKPNAWREGGTMVLVSLTLFAVFGGFLGGFATPLFQYWPVLVILAGLALLVQAMRRRV